MGNSKLISFWGKGGVGKTTLSAATAVGLSRDYRVLFISTDPVPTLNKILFSNGHVTDDGYLEVLELSEEEIISLWKKRFGREVYEVISSFLPVEEDIIDYIAGAPGISDEFMMYYIMEVLREGKYDFIVWDTVAAGGSLRLLKIEEELYSHLGEAVKLYLRVKGVLEKIKRGGKEPLELLYEWREIANDVIRMMASTEHSIYIVAQPEPLGYHVTSRIISELDIIGATPRKIILNMICNESLCPGCLPLVEKARMHREFLSLFKKDFQEKTGLCLVPWLGKSLMGRNALLELYDNYLNGKCIDI